MSVCCTENNSVSLHLPSSPALHIHQHLGSKAEGNCFLQQQKSDGKYKVIVNTGKWLGSA